MIFFGTSKSTQWGWGFIKCWENFRWQLAAFVMLAIANKDWVKIVTVLESLKPPKQPTRSHENNITVIDTSNVKIIIANK